MWWGEERGKMDVRQWRQGRKGSNEGVVKAAPFATLYSLLLRCAMRCARPAFGPSSFHPVPSVDSLIPYTQKGKKRPFPYGRGARQARGQLLAARPARLVTKNLPPCSRGSHYFHPVFVHKGGHIGSSYGKGQAKTDSRSFL